MTRVFDAKRLSPQSVTLRWLFEWFWRRSMPNGFEGSGLARLLRFSASTWKAATLTSSTEIADVESNERLHLCCLRDPGREYAERDKVVIPLNEASGHH